MVDEPLYGWHFGRQDRRLGYGDNRLIEAGALFTTPVTAERPLELCKWGLHGSVRAIDALGYIAGPVVSRVCGRGQVLLGGDKWCASERLHLYVADATAVLWEFTCDTAERALQRERTAGREPDAASWAAVEVRRRWLRGEATGADLAAAWAAEREAQNADLERRLRTLLGMDQP